MFLQVWGRNTFLISQVSLVSFPLPAIFEMNSTWRVCKPAACITRWWNSVSLTLKNQSIRDLLLARMCESHSEWRWKPLYNMDTISVRARVPEMQSTSHDLFKNPSVSKAINKPAIFIYRLTWHPHFQSHAYGSCIMYLPHACAQHSDLCFQAVCIITIYGPVLRHHRCSPAGNKQTAKLNRANVFCTLNKCYKSHIIVRSSWNVLFNRVFGHKQGQ